MFFLACQNNKYKKGCCVYKELQAGIEKEIINYSLEKCNNNVSATSKMMGLKNRSTLCSMMNRLGIDLGELKENPTK